MRRKGGEEKKAMVALVVFVIPTLEKKLLDAKGPFGGNVFKIRLDINKWATITKEVYTQLYPKIATIVYSKYSAVSDWFKFPG